MDLSHMNCHWHVRHPRVGRNLVEQKLVTCKNAVFGHQSAARRCNDTATDMKQEGITSFVPLYQRQIRYGSIFNTDINRNLLSHPILEAEV